jgi:asparagine N-glycosylation enzyme membrane subunit Stt3
MPVREIGLALYLLRNSLSKARRISMFTILLVVLVLMLLGALPTWPHSRSWGYYPSGGLGLIVVVILVLLLAGRL